MYTAAYQVNPVRTVMQNIYKQTIVAGITLASFVFSATAVMADGTTPTPTPTPETRVECTTGSYGQQTCKTVVIEKTAPVKHEVVNSGVQENIVAILIAGFAISAFGYTFSRGNR